MNEGRCLCGGVTRELSGEPFQAFNCHCKMCRKAHGTPFGTYWFFRPDQIRLTGGADKIAHYQPSPRLSRRFCGVCGSKMPNLDPARDIAIVPMGVLDDDPGVKAENHMFVDYKAAWHDITDDLPAYPEYPPA